MAKITAHELLFKELSTQEVVEAAWGVVKGTHMILTQAIDDQNLGKAGEAKQTVYQAMQLLERLNEKLNGKKEPTVVQ